MPHLLWASEGHKLSHLYYICIKKTPAFSADKYAMFLGHAKLVISHLIQENNYKLMELVDACSSYL